MVSRTRNDPRYGEGEVELDADDEVLLDESELSARRMATFKDPSYKPPRLPAVATQLLELSARADVNLDAVDRTTPRILERAVEALGLNEEQLELIRGEAEGLAERLPG